MDALPFLAAVAKSKRQPVYVLAGDEDFLKRRCRDAIVRLALGDADPAFAVSTYAGDKLDFSTVRNELDTLPFLSPCRVVVVDAADTFVTAHRPALERFAAAPAAAGVLVLDVKAFPENTKLAKALPDAAKVHCKAPAAYKLSAWVQDWAKAGHGKKLSADAAGLLIDLAGNTMGQLDQELEKLAVAAGAKGTIEAADVHRLVGRSQGADVFRILDAVGDGKPAAALTILERLFAEGVAPMGVLAPLMSQLRKLAAVGRHLADGVALASAMDAAKVPNWPQARESFKKQVRWLGRRRLDALSGWLVDIDRDLKGGSPLPERVQVERLVVKLARPRA